MLTHILTTDSPKALGQPLKYPAQKNWQAGGGNLGDPLILIHSNEAVPPFLNICYINQYIPPMKTAWRIQG